MPYLKLRNYIYRPSRRVLPAVAVVALCTSRYRRPSRRLRPSSVRLSRRIRSVVAVVVLCPSVRPVVRPVAVVPVRFVAVRVRHFNIFLMCGSHGSCL